MPELLWIGENESPVRIKIAGGARYSNPLDIMVYPGYAISVWRPLMEVTSTEISNIYVKYAVRVRSKPDLRTSRDSSSVSSAPTDRALCLRPSKCSFSRLSSHPFSAMSNYSNIFSTPILAFTLLHRFLINTGIILIWLYQLLLAQLTHSDLWSIP